MLECEKDNLHSVFEHLVHLTHFKKSKKIMTVDMQHVFNEGRIVLVGIETFNNYMLSYFNH